MDNIQEWRDANKFVKLLNETFIGFGTIQPGNQYALRAMKMFKQYGEQMTIDTCKMFIDQNKEFSFSNDYKNIKRNNINKWQ